MQRDRPATTKKPLTLFTDPIDFHEASLSVSLKQLRELGHFFAWKSFPTMFSNLKNRIVQDLCLLKMFENIVDGPSRLSNIKRNCWTRID